MDEAKLELVRDWRTRASHDRGAACALSSLEHPLLDVAIYGGDNQYGRTQKFVPKAGVDPALVINPPWVAR